MSKSQANDGIGKDPATVDEDQPDQDAVRSALGFDDQEDLEDLVDQLTERDIDPVVATLLQRLIDERTALCEQVAELEQRLESRTETIQQLAKSNNELRDRVEELDEREEKTRDVAQSAIAKAQQIESDPNQQEDAEELPHGVEPSTSPLDFFANCRATKIEELFVEDSNRTNTYRAIAVAKRWPEFATERTDGSGVFFTKDDLTTALTAHLGKEPHRQTVKRVWETLQELGGDDITAKTRQVGRRQEPKEILAMDMDTAEGLLEKRYVGLDLLDDSPAKASTGGVTPVVTGETESAL